MKVFKIANFIPHAVPYILNDVGEIELARPTHTDAILEKYNLEDNIETSFFDNFEEDLDWESDTDWEFILEYVQDFMQDNGIFKIVVDTHNKQVYVRPRKEENPSSIQMKEISDWAIENGWSENVIIDMVLAKTNIFKIAQEYQTNDGQEITFRVFPFNENDDRRGFVVHKITAHVGLYEVGYINLSYIPKEKWDSIYQGNIWKFNRFMNGDSMIPDELWDKNDETISDYVDSKWSIYDDDWAEYKRPYLEKEMSLYYEFFVDKPIIDFSRVYDDDYDGSDLNNRRKGIGSAMYKFAIQWLKDTFGLRLFRSGVQSDDAKNFYTRIKEKGILPLKKYKPKINSPTWPETREYFAKMNIFKIAQKYKTALNDLDQAFQYVFESNIQTIDKKQLMPLGVMEEYGSVQFLASNIKFVDDKYFIKVYYQIWTGENNGYGAGVPKNVPIYKGFVEGSRLTPWPEREDINTLDENYGMFSKLVEMSQPYRKNMVRIGEFKKETGNAIDIANKVKSMIDNWGDDDDFAINDISPSPDESFSIHSRNEINSYKIAQNEQYPIEIGKTYWFEYHCNESHDSSDADLWYKSHQPIVVKSLEETGYGNNPIHRGELGHPAMYKVKFEDGVEKSVFEDEIMDSPEEFFRPDPPQTRI